MKELTVNRLASANLRAHKREYATLTLGIFLSVFLISFLCVCGWGVYSAKRDAAREKVGYSNGFIPYHSSISVSDEFLRDSGMFDEIGHVFLPGKVPEADAAIGYYDETAARLMNRKLISGRMPERTGELAAEESMLARINQKDARVGDVITLTLTGMDNNTQETRDYTLCGILKDQSDYLDPSMHFYSGGTYMKFPAALVCPEEPAASGGQVWVLRPYTTRPMVTFFSLYQRFCNRSPRITMIGITAGGTLEVYPDGSGIADVFTSLFSVILIIVLSLLLCCAVGISSALESQLSRKTEEIGMLRAVGATQRQIRRIFGRESYLLALTVSPAAILISILALAIFSALLPDQIAFSLNPLLLFPVLIFSMTVILLSSWLPLRRASSITPMQVLRDTSLLRYGKSIRPRKVFRPAYLLAKRRLMLQKSRLIGSALMTALVLITAGGLVCFSTVTFQLPDESNVPDYTIFNTNMETINDMMITPQVPVTDSQLAQYAQLPHLKSVETVRSAPVITALDIDPKETVQGSYRDYMDYRMSDYDDSNHRALSETLKISGSVIRSNLHIVDMDEAFIKQLGYEGHINIDALNAGKEVILYTPDLWITEVEGGTAVYTRDLGNPKSVHLTNDFFTPGMNITVNELWQSESDPLPDSWTTQFETGSFPSPEESYRMYCEIYNQAHKTQAEVTVSALLKTFPTNLMSYTMLNVGDVITTPQGAQAMGIQDRIEIINLYLDGEIDPDTQSVLDRRVNEITMRTQYMTISNTKAGLRESVRQHYRMVLLFTGVGLLFFFSALALIVNNAVRQLQADRRTLGMLRAVGADIPTLLCAYSVPVILSIALGAVPAMIAMPIIHRIGYISESCLPEIGVQVLFALLLALSCLVMLRIRGEKLLRTPIVETIKEL